MVLLACWSANGIFLIIVVRVSAVGAYSLDWVEPFDAEAGVVD